MGILARFKDIMSSNINAFFDKMEDPEKMIDQVLRDLESDLGEVKAETASVMAEEARAQRALNECQAEVDKLQSYAEKAVLAGNDKDAAIFLQKKNGKSRELQALQQAYDLAKDNSTKMRQMFDHLNDQIYEMQAKKTQIKAKVAVAKTQEKINKLTESVQTAKGTMNKFDALEAKADKMLDKANAMAELNGAITGDVMEDLMDKYDTTTTESVDEELAALKARLGRA
ncbi:MAG: PspA/IM30 family protein [Firmicutes bacterium]|nr:PspA/IM30 family protein [Bacillota bacterium]MBQ5960193.1 PspA/IM30 family protein [Bacillota bacterium]